MNILHFVVSQTWTGQEFKGSGRNTKIKGQTKDQRSSCTLTMYTYNVSTKYEPPVSYGFSDIVWTRHFQIYGRKYKVYDLIHHTEIKQIPGLLMLIDFEKAFDPVSWQFLHKIMAFGGGVGGWGGGG